MAVLELYSKRDGKVQGQGGLNWGFSAGHVCQDDAYVAITSSFIRAYPDFFPKKGGVINVIWDDGTTMLCSVEGTQEINGECYPKNLTSAYDKSIFGSYMRRRLGLPSGSKVVMGDLERYGRKEIEIMYLGNNKYSIDFSV